MTSEQAQGRGHKHLESLHHISSHLQHNQHFTPPNHSGQEANARHRHQHLDHSGRVSNSLFRFISFVFYSILHPVFDGVLIDHPAWMRNTSRTASPSSTATHSGMNPPTTLADSTTMSNVQELEEEVIRLRQKQTEMDEKVDAANDKLATALGEITSLRQMVEAMQEQMFSTPPHLQHPASCSRSRPVSRPASCQASAPPQHQLDTPCTDLVPAAQPSPASAIALPSGTCADVVLFAHPNPLSRIELVAMTMLEDVASSSHPSWQGSTELAGVNQATASEPRDSRGDWNPPERMSVNFSYMYSTDETM